MNGVGSSIRSKFPDSLTGSGRTRFEGVPVRSLATRSGTSLRTREVKERAPVPDVNVVDTGLGGND